MFSVYILYSSAIDRYYIGMSSDPKKRLWYHNHKSQGYTKRANDWKIEWSQSFKTKKEALQCENDIKSKKSRRYIELLVSEDLEYNG